MSRNWVAMSSPRRTLSASRGSVNLKLAACGRFRESLLAFPPAAAPDDSRITLGIGLPCRRLDRSFGDLSPRSRPTPLGLWFRAGPQPAPSRKASENIVMDRESVERLRFDRRLARRRDWVDENDVEANIDALPDLTDKMTTVAELEAEEAATAEAAALEAPMQAPASIEADAPVPIAGEFGGSTNLGGSSFGGSFGGSSPDGTLDRTLDRTADSNSGESGNTANNNTDNDDRNNNDGGSSFS